MKKLMQKMMSLLLVAMMVTSMLATPASAAVNSSGIKTQTITVVTKSGGLTKPYITLVQTKGTLKYKKSLSSSATKTMRLYMSWEINVRASDNSDTRTIIWNSGSKTIKLERGKTYTITVAWNSQANTITLYNYLGNSWTTMPTWSVKKAWRVQSYK